MGHESPLVPLSELASWVRKYGDRSSEPHGFEGCRGKCYCCGKMSKKWTLIYGVQIGLCCWNKLFKKRRVTVRSLQEEPSHDD